MNSAERLAIRFQGDLREQILATLPHGDEDRPVLETLDLSDLLIKHMNWTSRLVVARPRQVLLSSVLTSKRPLDGMCDEALSQLITKIRSGADITPHLSRNVSIGVDLRPTSSRTRRRDLDLMLNDWGVHHLHLSETKEGDGFVKRTGPVLFAAFQPDRAYLIDVVQHGKRNPDAWTEGRTLETIAREWPDAGLILEMKGILSG